MKAVIISGEKGKPINGKIVDQEVPTPEDDQVLIKIAVAGSNPKDWKYPSFFGQVANSGDDIAGTIEKVGKNVTEFKAGDRVGAFHKMGAEWGAFAEYGIAYAATTFHLPSNISFEEAATIPLAAMTSVYGLFDRLQLPTPLRPATEEIPLLVYGASSAVGAFVIKLAKLANIHPIIGVAGAGSDFAKEIGADIVVDRRQGDVVEGIKKALGGKKLLHAYDAICEGDSTDNVGAVLSEGGKQAVILPVMEKCAKHVQPLHTLVSDAHKGEPYQLDIAFSYYRLFSHWLADGRFKAHPYEVVPGGLAGVEEGLRKLQNGEVSSKKLLFRISETSGL